MEDGGASKGRTLAIGALALLAAVAIPLLLVELALRVAMPAPTLAFIQSPNRDTEEDSGDGVLPGLSGKARFRTNSLGLRADEPSQERDLRVVTLGGSATECLLLDQEEAWPSLLQEALGPRVWVGNGGRSGHGTREHVLQAREIVKTVPDLRMVVVVPGVNDLLRRLGEDDRFDAAFTGREGWERAVVARAFAVFPPPADATWWQRTQLWQRGATVGRTLSALAEARRRGTMGRGADAVLQWRAARAKAARLRDELPDLEPALAEYRANLGRIADAVREAGAEPVLVTPPAIWRADLPPDLGALLWMGGVGDFQRAEGGADFYTPGALATGLARYAETLLGVCAERGLACVDLARDFPADTSAFYDDVHFNEAGARLVAERLAAELGARLVAAGAAPPDQPR